MDPRPRAVGKAPPSRAGDQWQARFDAGVENFRRLVYAFYDADFNFGRFLAQPLLRLNG